MLVAVFDRFEEDVVHTGAFRTQWVSTRDKSRIVSDRLGTIDVRDDEWSKHPSPRSSHWFPRDRRSVSSWYLLRTWCLCCVFGVMIIGRSRSRRPKQPKRLIGPFVYVHPAHIEATLDTQMALCYIIRHTQMYRDLIFFLIIFVPEMNTCSKCLTWRCENLFSWRSNCHLVEKTF